MSVRLRQRRYLPEILIAISQIRPVRQVAVISAMGVVLAGASVAWLQVVDHLRNPPALEVSGRPSAIVWSNRVFRSEAELAAWFRARGVKYERWALLHPQAAAVLSRKRQPPTSLRKQHTAQPRSVSTASGRDIPFVSLRSAGVPAIGILAAILALIASVPGRIIRRGSATRAGPVLALASTHRLYFVASSLAIGLGIVIGSSL
jgi:hypothetical protein